MTTHNFHNRILNSFGSQYYGKILNRESLIEEIVVDDIPYWYATMNSKKYLIDRDIISKLPIKIIETSEVHHAKKVYHVIKQYQTVIFKQEMNYTFREMIDMFCEFKHTNPLHFLLYKLTVFASELDRVNFRVATNAGFGKDSIWEALHILRRDVAVINPRTMPSLEYRLMNKVLVLNEMSNMDSSQRDLIQEFLLLCGDMRTTYEKSSRAGNKTKDYYNIKNLSLVCMFNDYEYYENIGKEKKFFDNTFTKAVMDRFVPFKFNGVLESSQFKLKEPEQDTVERNTLTYIKLLRTIEYFKHNWRNHIKPYTYVLESNKYSPREQGNLDKILSFINLYSKDEEEFKVLTTELLKCNSDYRTMMLEGNKRNKKHVKLFAPLQVN